MKNKTTIIASILFLTVATLPVFADIDTVNQAVQQANEEADPATENEQNTQSSAQSAQAESNSDSLFDVFMMIWLINNFTAKFEPYPYAYDNKYIHFNYADFNVHTTTEDDRSFRFTLLSDIAYQKDFGVGNETCLEGYLFKCFGPLIENTIYTDTNEMTGFIKCGGELALLQTNPISIVFYCQWVHWYGALSASLPQNGCAFGLFLRSYITKPFVIEWKFGGQSFGEAYASFYESDLRAGVLFDRFEVFGGWRYFNVSDSTTESIYYKSNGLSVGTRVYF